MRPIIEPNSAIPAASAWSWLWTEPVMDGLPAAHCMAASAVPKKLIELQVRCSAADVGRPAEHG